MTPYKTIEAYSVTMRDGLWQQTLTTGPDFLCQSFDEGLHALANGQPALVDGAVCMALRRALGVVPDAQEVTA